MRPRVHREGVTAWFLEPHDAAVSKLARGEPRDLRWVRAGLRAGLLTPALLSIRHRQTRFLDDAEQAQSTQGYDFEKDGKAAERERLIDAAALARTAPALSYSHARARW